MIKKLDRYLLRYFFTTLFVIVVSIGLTIIVINMVEQLRNFVDNEVPIQQIVEYYIYFSGWVIKSFFPVFILLATLLSISMLSRKNEILAIKASGISLYRVALPLLIVSLVLSVGHFYFNEYIFPPANKRLLEIKEFEIKNRSKRRYVQVANVYRQIEPGHFYTIASFNVERQQGTDLKIYKTEGNRLKEILTAQQINYQNHRWTAVSGVLRTFDDSARESSYTQFAVREIPYIDEKPDDLARKIGDPADMGLEELKDYISLMKRTGGPYHREAIDLKVKYAYPMISFIIMLSGIPIAALTRRGGVAVSFSMGALIALVYFVLFRILQSAGYNEKVPDLVAVWGVNGAFFLLGIITMIKARK